MKHIPNIAYEGDFDTCHAFLPMAQQLLGVVAKQMTFNDLGVYRGHLRLSDTAYCYVVIAGGVSSIRVVADGGANPAAAPISQHWKTPDFLSGVVLGGRKTTTSTGVALCHSFLPTPECGRLFGLNAQGQPVHFQDSAKLAVEGFSGIADNNPNSVIQYVQSGLIRATQWTGTMRKCVQALLGFGKPGKKSIYARAAMTPADQPWLRQGKTRPTAYEQQVANQGRQVRYDYRFYRTHGLVKAADGVWWLVEIGMTRGVVAMPLPLYDDTRPGNTSKSAQKFRAKLRKLDDTAAQTLIDTLGGFPTGESFPVEPAAFEAWVKAGKILRLLPASAMSGFYLYQAYSSILGWAFSDSGHEAHNTAWTWDYTDNGNIHAIHDRIVFQFGATVAPLRTAAAVKPLRTALQGLEKDHPATYAANIYKLQRLSNDDFDRVVEENTRWGAAAAYTLLDGMTGAALCTAHALRDRVSTGKLWDQAKPAGQVQLKFPEPIVTGKLISFNFNPDVEHPQASPLQECDTTVHVFFIGEELHWVKYFCTGKVIATQNTDDFEDCMYIGSWSSESITNAFVPKMFYTSQFDDRKEVGAFQTNVHITSEDLGYTRAEWGDWLDQPEYSTMRRHKSFHRTRVTVDRSGSRLQTEIAIPFGDRASYFYAHLDGYETVTRREEQGYVELTDPWVAYGNRKWLNYRRDQIPECGNPDARRCMNVEYQPGPCSDIADEGQWIFKCDNFEEIAFNITLPALPNTVTVTREEASLTVKLVCGYDGGNPVIVQKASSGDIYWGASHWFIPSPEPKTDWMAWLWTTHNALGDMDIVHYSQTPDGFPILTTGELGYAELPANPMPTYVGVV